MNSIIGIALKDTKTFFRERGTVFWTIAFPVLILLLFSAIFGREIPFNANIGIVDYSNDQGGMTSIIVSGLNATGVFTIKNFTDKTEALRELNATNVRALITIPENFTQDLFFSGHTNISLAVDETSPMLHGLSKTRLEPSSQNSLRASRDTLNQ
jgi:ABC-type Na+ efflux pump permease subunit